MSTAANDMGDGRPARSSRRQFLAILSQCGIGFLALVGGAGVALETGLGQAFASQCCGNLSGFQCTNNSCPSGSSLANCQCPGPFCPFFCCDGVNRWECITCCNSAHEAVCIYPALAGDCVQ
jgi:hypothetical protein